MINGSNEGKMSRDDLSRMNDMNEVIDTEVVYTRTNVDKASVLQPTTSEGQRKIITYF